MTINISVPSDKPVLTPRIIVIGVGGAGGNAVSNMIRADLEGVEFIVANTDSQALSQTLAERKIQLGETITRGLGAGARPDVGRAAAEETIEEIMARLSGSNMVFITAGMGGGTGSGAAPVIARAAREHGLLTVGVVTKPFQFEGQRRMGNAEAAIEELSQFVDTLIIIPNQNLFQVADDKTTFADAFKMADEVLHSGVRGVTDLMVMPGMINLDFADIRTVMSEMGKAMMGTGQASGERRATDAAEAAINNPLLEDVTMTGARSLLINITGGLDMTLFEIDEAAQRIRAEVGEDANIIFGSTFDESLEGVMRVSVVATGIASEADIRQPPLADSTLAAASQPGATQLPPMTGGRDILTTGGPVPTAAPPPGAIQPVFRSIPPQPQPVQTPISMPPVVEPPNVPPSAQPTGLLPDQGTAVPVPPAPPVRTSRANGRTLLQRVTRRPQAEPAPVVDADVPAKEARQPQLTAPTRSERVTTHQHDETLDIPSFLRRQAS